MLQKSTIEEFIEMQFEKVWSPIIFDRINIALKAELGTDNQNFHRQPIPTISKQHRQTTNDMSVTKPNQRQR